MSTEAPQKLTGWDWWRSIGAPKFITAPMVDGSELPFRLLTREFGAQLCYTPMLHSKMMTTSDHYFSTNFTTSPADRPVVAQLCGNDPEIVLAAAKMVEPFVDAVDLNLGCPQRIAKSGNYGSYLLDTPDVIFPIVRALATGLARVPVTCKIRILHSKEETIALAKKLVECGASLLVVHGRHRTNMKQFLTVTDWDIIRDIKAAIPEVPIVANGSIAALEDVEACLAYTKVDGVMSSEAVLENPGFFSRSAPISGPLFEKAQALRVSLPDELKAVPLVANQIAITKRYMEIAEANPVGFGTIKSHVIKYLFGLWRVYPELRDEMVRCYSMDRLKEVMAKVTEKYFSEWEHYLTDPAYIAPEEVAPKALNDGSFSETAEKDPEKSESEYGIIFCPATPVSLNASTNESSAKTTKQSELAPLTTQPQAQKAPYTAEFRDLGVQPFQYTPSILAQLDVYQSHWKTEHEKDSRIAWPTPEYMLDPARPGSWYMRHSPGRFDQLKPYFGLPPPFARNPPRKKKSERRALRHEHFAQVKSLEKRGEGVPRRKGPNRAGGFQGAEESGAEDDAVLVENGENPEVVLEETDASPCDGCAGAAVTHAVQDIELVEAEVQQLDDFESDPVDAKRRKLEE